MGMEESGGPGFVMENSVGNNGEWYPKKKWRVVN
jgi:hypothetical protein